MQGTEGQNGSALVVLSSSGGEDAVISSRGKDKG